MRIEEKIRDFLAKNIEFISEDLTLIKSEFYLKAKIGAKGYIDILAKDTMNNFVVIEIKRSETAARQAIHELLKYQGLLKQLYRAQESEIKLIIISTSWNELIIPFSEVYDSVSILGLKIQIDKNYIPVSKEIIEPVDLNILSRKLSPSHSLDLFYTSQKRDDYIINISEKLKKRKIDDFVFVKLKSSGKNPRIMYPFMSYLAFQRQHKSSYFEVIPNLRDELESCDFESESHELNYIDTLLLVSLDKHLFNDSTEYGSPRNFMNLLHSGNWKIEMVQKFGVFANDPRITNELILNEIKGYDGENENKYLDFADSVQPKKLDKLIKNLVKPLSDNEEWASHILDCFNYIKSISNSFKVVVEVFYPNSIFDSIFRGFIHEDLNYLPLYKLFFALNDNSEIIHFYGNIVWNGNLIDEEQLYNYFMQGDSSMKFMLSMNGNLDNILLPLLNLSFSNRMTKIKNGIDEDVGNISFEKNDITRRDIQSLPIHDFYDNNLKGMALITALYKNNSISI